MGQKTISYSSDPNTKALVQLANNVADLETAIQQQKDVLNQIKNELGQIRNYMH